MSTVDQPTKTEELRRRRLMAVTFMWEAIRRSGSANPNQFGRWFDAQTATWTHIPKSGSDANAKSGQLKATEDQKKWYPFAKGESPLSKATLSYLARLLPDIYSNHWSGPERLWEALWGPPEDLWSICGASVYQSPLPKPDADPELFAGSGLPFEESLHNFEASLLARHLMYGPELELRDLTESIAMYRLHQSVNRLAKTGGAGAYRCVRICLDAPEVRWHLRSLSAFANFSLYDELNSELVATELDRLKREPSYRTAIDTSDVQAYVLNPREFCSEEQKVELALITP
ncbi:hypothetical protein SAMN05443245_0461 [Paraburkholderia fungorum]|uniref:Uncharacterized protein n=1 Tax=Paraburkholderia fungorum TaxID=134537 RepID=A0A1H0Z5C0_9BURK|nr:hypothetical protein [Paraburkholderia fungorum]SDQ22649.1 hypothetical protein SAMN05443245_0461 [Paraburkholderia fungorum]